MGAEGESSVSLGGAEEVNVYIRGSSGSKFNLKTSLESTVAEFKGLLAQNCDMPADRQRLIYKGRILKDDQTLASYGLQADHTVHMVCGSAPAPTPPSTASIGATDGVAAATRDGGVAGAGVSLFPGLGLGAFNGTGASESFGAGLPEFEQVQQQLTQNPNMMREIMNMPAVQSLMNNPEIMRSLIMSNPQMREIIERNPELAHILNDPSILRQTLEAARNPELMREMMRNTDRAMSNIESSPEGFNMLRRMYENVQEPFLNATTMGGNAATDTGSNPFAAFLGNQAGSRTRDGSDYSSAGPQMTTGTTVPNADPLPNPWNNTGVSQTNNVTRTNPSGNATLPSIAGLGGLILPELESLGMPNTSTLNQLMQNPVAPQTMQLPNPQLMDHMFNLNSQLRAMLDTNPQLREMMQNPETLRELIPPSTMQRMMALQQLSQHVRQQSTQEGSQLGQTTAPPEELYATQLSQLQEMGFFDTQENIRALQATAGNMQAAVDRLLRNIGQY